MPTQRDVARRAGVSQALTSYVLAGVKGKSSEETKKRVLKAARELGYQPNLLARGLRGGRTGLLGVIVRDSSAPAAVEVCRALFREGPQLGFDVMLTDAAGSPATLLRLASLMRTRLCDGLVLVGELHDQAHVWKDYPDTDIPTVAVLQDGPASKTWSVQVDSAAGIRQAVGHVVALGHRSLGFVGADYLVAVRRRRELFQQIVAERRLGLCPQHLVTTELSRDGGARGLRQLLRQGTPPTAVVAAADLLASGILREAPRCGLRVPEDLSIVGFDDIPEAELLQPPLTTLRLPVERIARAVLGYFTSVPESVTEQALCLLEPTLVVRGSTAPPRGR